ncbi:MAG: hypothetical protein RQ875_10035 [Vicingaceae bacterium]|nr:hypothetical protein [Vicingaceae bacterium]
MLANINLKIVIMLFVVCLITQSIKAQKTPLSLGGNFSVFTDKINGGVNFTMLKKGKQLSTYSPSWRVNINYGILASKNIKQDLSAITIDSNGFGIKIDPSTPFYYDVPPFGFITIQHKVQNIGFNVSIIKDFYINDFLFFGLGLGTTINKDKGFVVWYNPRTEERIKNNIEFNSNTFIVITEFGYYKNLSHKLLFTSVLRPYFSIPYNSRSTSNPNYIFDSSLPLIGNVLEISISINYKLN